MAIARPLGAFVRKGVRFRHWLFWNAHVSPFWNPLQVDGVPHPPNSKTYWSAASQTIAPSVRFSFRFGSMELMSVQTGVPPKGGWRIAPASPQLAGAQPAHRAIAAGPAPR